VIRLDDISMRDINKSKDKFAAAREIFEAFNEARN
jgi:hypothetical protein